MVKWEAETDKSLEPHMAKFQANVRPRTSALNSCAKTPWSESMQMGKGLCTYVNVLPVVHHPGQAWW